MFFFARKPGNFVLGIYSKVYSGDKNSYGVLLYSYSLKLSGVNWLFVSNANVVLFLFKQEGTPRLLYSALIENRAVY